MNSKLSNREEINNLVSTLYHRKNATRKLQNITNFEQNKMMANTEKIVAQSSNLAHLTIGNYCHRMFKNSSNIWNQR